MVLRPGYMIQVTSWENDADNYRTETIDGLPKKEDVSFLIDWVKTFLSNGNRREKTGLENLGNAEIEDAHLMRVLANLRVKHPNISTYLKELILRIIEDEDGIFGLVVALLSEPVEYEWGHCRVYDNHSVYFIPELISLEDIADQF